MTKMTLLALVTLFLSSCITESSRPEPYSLQMAQNDCAAENAPFELLSGCLQSKMQNRQPEWVLHPDADLLQVYFSWLSAAGNRVARGEMSESDGRFQADQLLARLRSINTQRMSAARQQALSNALAGFAILNSAQQQPSGAIVCQTIPTGLGTTRTSCH